MTRVIFLFKVSYLSIIQTALKYVTLDKHNGIFVILMSFSNNLMIRAGNELG